MYYFPQFLIFHTAKLHKKESDRHHDAASKPLFPYYFIKQVYLKLVMPWT